MGTIVGVCLFSCRACRGTAGRVSILLDLSNASVIIILKNEGLVKFRIIFTDKLTISIVRKASENITATVLFLGDPAHRIILILCCSAYAIDNLTHFGLIVHDFLAVSIYPSPRFPSSTAFTFAKNSFTFYLGFILTVCN